MKIASKRSRKTLRKSKRKTLRKSRRKTLRKTRRQQRGGLFNKKSKSKSKAFCTNHPKDCIEYLNKKKKDGVVTIQCKNKNKTTVITKTEKQNWNAPEWEDNIRDAWILGKGKCNCGLLNACNN